MAYQTLKRGLDVLGAGLGLLLLAPVAVLLGLLVKLSDGGPIFYGQIRVGRGGREFRIWKFRSMVVNADKLGIAVTKDADPRITRVGRFLRKTKLDELPQLWNVLAGEMSLVGPRPEVPRYVAKYTPEQRTILELKPGITDLASLLFRHEEALLRGVPDVESFYVRHCLPQKIELNREYAARAGLFQDIGIILRTVCPAWSFVAALYFVALSASFWAVWLLAAVLAGHPVAPGAGLRVWPVMVLPQLALLYGLRQMQGMLGCFGGPEIRRMAMALGLAAVLQVGWFQVFPQPEGPTRIIFVLAFVLAFVVLLGIRMAFRRRWEAGVAPVGEFSSRSPRLAIIGAGPAATRLAATVRARQQVVAFFADNPHYWCRRPYDIPVVGMPECLLNPEWEAQIDEVVVAVPGVHPERMNEIMTILQGRPWKVAVAGAA